MFLQISMGCIYGILLAKILLGNKVSFKNMLLSFIVLEGVFLFCSQIIPLIYEGILMLVEKGYFWYVFLPLVVVMEAVRC